MKNDRNARKKGQIPTPLTKNKREEETEKTKKEEDKPEKTGPILKLPTIFFFIICQKYESYSL